MTAPVAASGAATPSVRGSSTAGPARALSHASIGTVPILWNNVDLRDVPRRVAGAAVIDEIARLGYEGTQFGIGFPDGEELKAALQEHGLRLAEVYAPLACTADGPLAGALAAGRERLALLHDAGGDVLVAALDGSPERDQASGRAWQPGTPRLTDAGSAAVASLLEQLAREAAELGHPLAFHPHTATWIETPDEVARLVDGTDPELVGICLDVGHFTVGGGDPVEAIRGYRDRVRHLHLKDVDAAVLERLRKGQITGFHAALRERVFTELGAGVLDLPGIIDALVELDYGGWLMVEQDTTWRAPSESAAIGRAVLEYELRQAARRAGPQLAASDR